MVDVLTGGEQPEAVEVIDCHNHALPEWAIGAFRRHLADTGTTSEGPAQLWAHPAWGNPTAQVASLNAQGIDRAVITQSSNAPTALHAAGLRRGLDAPGAIAAANQELRSWAAATEGRLLAACWVDPRLPDSALAEVERAQSDGALGAVSTLCTHRGPNGARFLDHPQFEPFLAAAAAARVPVFVHPSGLYSLDCGDPAPAGLGLECLKGGLAMLVEATLCLVRLVLSGTFDRHPSLRVVSGQLGGVFPFVLGRFELIGTLLEHADDSTGNGIGAARSAPGMLRHMGDYAGQIFVDTHSMGAPALDCALESLGQDRVVFGSDFPVTPERLGRGRGLDTIRGLGLDADVLAAILGGNAASLLGLRQEVSA